MLKGHIRRSLRKAGIFLRKNAGLIVPAVGALMVGAHDVMAWTAPSTSSGPTFAYDVYDIAINKIAKGPIGFVAGAGLLAGGIFLATRNAWVPAITMMVGAGVLYKLDTIATSLGYVV